MTYNVIQGRGFWHNRKRVLDFLLAVNSNESNLGPILSRFRNITAFVRQKPFSIPLLYSGLNFGVFPLEQTHDVWVYG